MKKNFKRLLALMLCCFMLLAIAACNDGSAPATSPTPDNTIGSSAPPDNTGPPADAESDPVSARDTLTVAVTGDAATLLPNGMSMSGLISAARMYCEPLWYYTKDGEIVPVLIESVDGINSTTWTLHLRDDVTFSNGSKFTAEDVLFTIQYYQTVQIGFYKEFNIEKAKILDDYTLELILEPYGAMLEHAIPELYMYDSETFDEADFVMNPVGTGPYVVEEYVINSHLYLKARDDYWGGKPKIENLHFMVFNEDAQITNALQSGEVDIVPTVPSQDSRYVETLEAFNVTKNYTYNAPNISFNFNPVSVMSNIDARLAVCYAVNRQAIIDLVYFGNATLLHFALSENCLDYEPALADLHDVYSTGMNLDLAKEYAEKAGIVGKDVVLITNGSSNYVTTAEIIQANLKEIGVNVIINNYDAASFTTIARDETVYDMFLTASYAPSGVALGMMVGTLNFAPPTRFTGWDTIDYFITTGDAAMENPDPAAQRETFLELAQLLVDEVVWYGICDIQQTTAINKELAGVNIFKNNVMLLDKWYWAS